MWGNLHGWLISLALSAVILSPIAWLVQLGRFTPPNGIALDAANLAAISLPVSPDAAWPIFTEASDAGDAYRKAIAGWNDGARQAAEQLVQSANGEAPPAIKNLLDARHCRRMTLFAADLGQLINYDSEHANLEAIFDAGNWACKIGLSLQMHGRTDQAVPYLEAAFALGRQLYMERIIYDEYQKGTQLMADAAEAMSQTVPRGSKAFDDLSEFQNRLSDYQERRVLPIWKVISSVDQQVIARSAGDILVLADQSAERMWRVEAAMKLGRYRFDAGTLGDQIGATRAIRQLAGDPDPAVAVAGAAARDLTREKYRMIR